MHDPHAPNRLAREKSPYLLQHARNPVDWYPWGEEAFARARAEDKPILLSIGYSTCHWCHVMERESFEDADVAALLNADFVCVKVDREERPDVDRVYMTALQAMGMGGGWPLNAFLTPALEPFWGGTYFPPTTRMGRPGLLQILPQLADAWRTRRDQVLGTGAQVMGMLHTHGERGGEPGPVPELAARAAAFLERQHDDACGGFGDAPKVPSPANLHVLLRRWARGTRGAETARRMVLAQLEAMRANGLHDHVAGGFHRYATDREWRIPHFEKMLYDQALLAEAYLDAFRATGEARWAETARGVFDYVARDLTSPEGAFHSAEDADAEGEEGRYHVWTPAQLAEVLGAADGALFAHHYGVTAHGNFEHGTTVLHEVHPPDDPATASRLAALRARVLAARERRVRPHLDDKVITAWNAQFIAALAHGARALDEPALAARAVRAADFVWDHLRAADGTLRRRWREGEAAGEGQLDDHAYYAHACLELFVATHEPRWLERAATVTTQLVERFRDPVAGGFFETRLADPASSDAALPRLKDGFDGAEGAGNSIAAEVLWRLGALLDRPEWTEQARRSFAYHARRLAPAPWA
ncbi:MAG: thioredoxin domain-containing protein, partial [bacterium]